jgi:hypothetical protein
MAPAAATRLSVKNLKDILALPDNGRCFDCDKKFAISSEIWAAVCFGIVLCSKCAKYHNENLSVKTGVRSLSMDNLTNRQVLALQLGSNGQLKGFFKRQHVEKTSPELLYKLNPASFYKRQLALELQKRLGPPFPKGVTEPTESLIVKMQNFLLIDGNLNFSGELKEGEMVIKLVKNQMTTAPLGLTLTETHGGRALVQKVKKDGIADLAGMSPGDYIIGIGEDREWRYAKVLYQITEWANIKPQDIPSSPATVTASKKKGKKQKEAETAAPAAAVPELSANVSISLKLVLWRPQWHPDAFILHTLQAKHAKETAKSLKEEQLKRTKQLLEEYQPAPVSGSGAGDWKSFMKEDSTTESVKDKQFKNEEEGFQMIEPGAGAEDSDDIPTSSKVDPAEVLPSYFDADGSPTKQKVPSLVMFNDHLDGASPSEPNTPDPEIPGTASNKGGGWLSKDNQDEWVGKKPQLGLDATQTTCFSPYIYLAPAMW